MRFWHLITTRLRAIVLRQRSETEMDEELRLHLERTIEQRIAAGMPPQEASRLSRLEFGGVEQIKEDCRDARGIGLFDNLARDTRHGVRRLVRDWHFTTAAVLILALGIGANTAIFSVVNAALLREQVFDRDRLVEIYQRFGDSGSPGGNTYPAYLDMAAYTDVFAATTAVLINGALYQGNEGLRTAIVEYTTPSYLSVLGLRPSRGRWFDPREDTRGAEVVAVVGYKTWQTRFASDPSIIGQTIRINAAPVTIIGIGPQGHNNTLNAGIVTDFWLPVSSMPALGEAPYSLDRRPPEPAFFVKARLREGKTVAEAQVAMDNLGRRLAADYPTEDPGKGIAVFSSGDVRVHPQIDALLAPIATVLLIIVGLTLAIACSNLATLLLVRGASRSKEVSVRLALGATRGQIVRHLVMESLILSVAGGIAGCVLAYWTVASLSSLGLPILVDVRLDYRVLGFTLVLSLLTGLAFGLTPALKATRIALLPTLRDEGGSLSLERHWFTLKNALLVFQVVMSFVLLAGTGLFVQFLLSAQHQDVGFTVKGVALLETDMRYGGYVGDQSQAAYRTASTTHRGASRCRASHPAARLSNVAHRPVRDRARQGISRLLSEFRGAARGGLWWLWAGPGYFDALRIPVLRGRVFDERDRLDTPRVAVISADTAVRYFGSLDAVGRRFRLENEPSSSWFEVIGVVKQTTPDVVDGTRPLFYRSYLQADRSSDHRARPNLARRDGTRRRDAARTAGDGPEAARHWRLDARTAHGECAVLFQSDERVSGRAWCPGTHAGRHRSLRRGRLRRIATVTRGRHTDGSRRAEQSGHLADRTRGRLGHGCRSRSWRRYVRRRGPGSDAARCIGAQHRAACRHRRACVAGADHGADDAGGVGRDLLPRPSRGEGRPGLGAATHLSRNQESGFRNQSWARLVASGLGPQRLVPCVWPSPES